MNSKKKNSQDLSINTFTLYGEHGSFPDVLHCERIEERAEKHDWQISPHRHFDLHQFFLFLNGKCEVNIDGYTQELIPPAIISIPARSVHSFRFSQGTTGFVVTIPVSELSQALDTNEELMTNLGRWGISTPDKHLSSLFEQIYYAQTNAGFARTLLLKSMAIQTACLVALSMDDAAPQASNQGSDYLKSFEQLLTRHVKDGWKVSDYAKALSITPTHLSRITREQTGHAASRLIETAVLREACRELAYTRKRIETIAYELGFQDPAYFSRAFRRNFASSPTEYRKYINKGFATD